MIQEYIYNQLKDDFTDFEWSVDYKTSNGNYGTVYYDGGTPINASDETEPKKLFYQVVIQNDDFDLSEKTAYEIKEKLHGLTNIQTYHFDRKLFIQYIFAENEPIRVGVLNDRMIYTINFYALIYIDCCD